MCGSDLFSCTRKRGISSSSNRRSSKNIVLALPVFTFHFLFFVFPHLFAQLISLSACAYAMLFGTFRNAGNVLVVGHVCLCVRECCVLCVHAAVRHLH